MLNKKIVFSIIATLTLLTAFYFLFLWRTEKIESENFTDNKKNEKVSELEVVSFISPHHLLAKEMIREIFSKVAQKNKDKKIDRVILISPDHFESLSGWGFLVSENSLERDGKSFPLDEIAARTLEKNTFLRFNNEKFVNEHGINNLLPYTKEYFPETKTLPIIIKNNTPAEKIDSLVNFLNKELEGNNLIIISSDFSHYLEKNISQLHDEKAISVMENMSFDKVYNLETDFVAGLYLAMKYSQINNKKTFELVGNSNSSEIYNKDFTSENTSYVTGYFSENEKNTLNEISSFLFLGDLMLDRHIRFLMEKKGVNQLTEKINRLFWSQDLNIANLEGPVTNNESVSQNTKQENPNNLKFTFNKNQTLDFLKYNRINFVNIGNNHIMNFGSSGLEETKKFLEENGISYIGDPKDNGNFFSKRIGNKKIAIISYNDFKNNNNEDIAKTIRKIDKENDFVFVYTHWGSEYSPTENSQQKELAHSFIDNGADLIIGSHPHVIQPMEIYKNKIIFYSLGNFIFDQYFSEETKNVMALNINISNEKIKIGLLPLKINSSGSLDFANEKERNEMLGRIKDNESLDEELKKEIQNGIFSFKFEK